MKGKETTTRKQVEARGETKSQGEDFKKDNKTINERSLPRWERWENGLGAKYLMMMIYHIKTNNKTVSSRESPQEKRK